MSFKYNVIPAALVPANAMVVNAGNPEKSRVPDYVRIENVSGDVVFYRFYNRGSYDKLLRACDCIAELTSGKKLSGIRSNQLYSVLFELLHTVHHHDTENRDSKLDGINSLSSCCLDNVMCLRRMMFPDLICSSCYAETQQKYQSGTAERNIINGVILKNVVLPVRAWKKYFRRSDLNNVFRIESFGDVANLIQVENYCNFCVAFPRVRFGAWTKNVFQWCHVFDRIGKPSNLSFVVSSPIVGKSVSGWVLEKWGQYIDHVFTVYEKGAGVPINCGGKHCRECLKTKTGCYYRRNERGGEVLFISEEKK